MGPAFAFMAACAFGLGTVLQQKGTLDTTSGRGDSRWLIQILHEPVWLAGGLLQASGWILQAVALDKGPLMAVQAITTLSLVIALPFGAWLTHQHVDRTVVLGAVAAARQWRRRDRPRTGSGVAKKFTARLKELNPWEAATVGVLEQPWTLTAAAAVVLVRHHSAPYRPPGPRHQPHADDQRARHVERPLRGDTHGGCGGRAGETRREQSRQGAPVRPNRQVLQDRASTAAKRLAAAEVQTATAIQEGPEMVGRARLTERQPRMFAHWAWMPDLSSGYG